MFDPTTLVGFHTWLSLIALATGVVVIIALIRGRAMPAWTAVFLLTTVATSATGFALPFERVLPSHIVGGIALVVLAIALLAQYRFRLTGAWRWIYAVASIASVYLLAFVGTQRARANGIGAGLCRDAAHGARRLRRLGRRGGADRTPRWGNRGLRLKTSGQLPGAVEPDAPKF